jgi:hypothetical protein
MLCASRLRSCRAFIGVKMKQALQRFGLFLAISAGVSLWTPPHAFALSFTDLVSFATPDHGYTTVSYGTNQSSGFGWQHDILEHLFGKKVSEIEILDLKTVIAYSLTNSAESWRIDGAAHLNAVGAMTQSEFILGEAFIKDLSLDGILNLMITEGTPGADSFRIFSSKLTGIYQLKAQSKETQIPEPGTFALLLAGWGILRAFRSGRTHHIA